MGGLRHDGRRAPLYCLQALREARSLWQGRPVIVVEREEYVNRLRTRLEDRMLATCCAGGLDNWDATHIEQLKDAGVEQVAVIPDDDSESRADAHAVACACHAAGLNVRVVDLPGPVKDVSAYLDTHTESDLAALIETAPRFTGPVPTRLSEVSAEPVSWLWPGWIQEGSVTMLDGGPGVGKTLITLDLAARVSTGHTMPDGRSGSGEPAAVVLVTGDDVTRTVMPRLDVVGADMTRIDHLPRDGDHLPTDTDLGAILGAVVAAKARLVVLDPLLSIVSPSGPRARIRTFGARWRSWRGWPLARGRRSWLPVICTGAKKTTCWSKATASGTSAACGHGWSPGWTRRTTGDPFCGAWHRIGR